MEEGGLDLLAFVSSFYRFAGPNNPILDLGNYLALHMGLKFGVVTTSNPLEPEFAKCVSFPVIRGLSGSSNSMLDRLVWGPPNVLRARRAIARLRPRRTFVVASHDTAFEVAIATGRRVVLGQNVLLNVAHRGWAKKFGIPFWRPSGLRSGIFETLDVTASRTILGGILAHSRFQKNLYMAMGIQEERIRIVPHCIDTKRIEETGDRSPQDSSDPDETAVLFAGHLQPWKGVIELLAAAKEAAKETRLVLRFVGQGPLEGQVRAATSNPGVGANLRVELLPWTSPSKLFDLMRKADIIAIPSCVELFGMAALEAMALGKPVIATRYGGIVEVIRHGQDGLLVNPFDRREFADALVRLAGDAALRRRLGTSGRDRVRSEYDVHAVAPQFVRAMEELC
jgi:glycosyltransferase involved in cell wall biosynthesis